MTMERLKPEHQQAAATTLAESFWDDPLMHIVAPDEKRRATVAPWFFATAVAYGLRWGEVSCLEDSSAVAVWLPPGQTHVSTGRMLRVGMGALPVKAGLSGTLRFMRALTATERFHKAVKGPRWYLMAIGTKPGLQGKGFGNALLEVGTSQADAAKIPCYLETATASNVAFYSKRGFEVTDQTSLYGFTLYGMVRQPKA
jgi:ribosomal protein S18 acetylase RimI-like enzyme